MRRCRTLVLATIVLTLASKASAQDRFFDSNGVRIRYVDQGSGQPIVLVHGLNNNVETWVTPGILANLARDYRVIAFDVRGHGKSGKPHDPTQYGREMGLDIVRLMDHLTIPRAHVVGYSLGGVVTTQLLTTHQDRFLTATLVASPPRLTWSDEAARAAEQEASERERECASRTLLERLAPLDGPKPTDEVFRVASEACFANPEIDRFAFAAMTRSRGDLVTTPAEAAAVRVPTLAVVGNQDGNLAGLQALKRLRPDLMLVVLDGATHNGDRGVLTRPELVTAIRQFLADHKQSK